ncbi:MAG: hypothetical protein ACLFMO_08080 [Eubacteriales bacterium]
MNITFKIMGFIILIVGIILFISTKFIRKKNINEFSNEKDFEEIINQCMLMIRIIAIIMIVSSIIMILL